MALNGCGCIAVKHATVLLSAHTNGGFIVRSSQACCVTAHVIAILRLLM
jgi:hypothetical protein